MDQGLGLPLQGLVAYLGPALNVEALAALEARGYRMEELGTIGGPEQALPEDADALILAVGADHPMRAPLRKEAEKRGIPCANDLDLLTVLDGDLATIAKRRVLISGSAGKSVTSALTLEIAMRGGLNAQNFSAQDGYLNCLSKCRDVVIFEVPVSSLASAARLDPSIVALLNLSEEDGRPISQKAKEAAADSLINARVSVLGADDLGTQSLMMRVRRQSARGDAHLVPISGGATLSDGCFAIEQAVYAIRNGRTRRIASFAGSAVLLGNHMAQNAAAASAIAAELGVPDDTIAAGLLAFRGVAGRFDCIGTNGRIVFVDDRMATCAVSTVQAIAACPDVFWIGHRHGDLSAKTKSLMKGQFFLASLDGSGPPVDGVVTFKDADDATAAALQAAQDLMRVEPRATPVVLFSPGTPGYAPQGELFRIKALDVLSDRSRAHG
ncbi:MAG: hypothetical protein AAF788_00480 [Pseudomonadota bacterium]